jgi:Methylamine utilisation protein MauE
MTPWLDDPVLLRALGAALSAVLLIGAVQKLREREVFADVLAQYRLLPAGLLPAVSWALPLLEAAAGLALLFAASRAAGAVLAVAVLAVVTGAVVVNLLRGRTELDCGCGGPGQRIGWGLVGRNALLMAAAVLAAGEGGPREFVWIDYVTLGGATLALLGLYTAVNQLMANQPRLDGLRKRA